jgi:hypothetical protein
MASVWTMGENKPSENMAQERILGSKREKITGGEECIMRRFVIGNSCQAS